MGGITQASDLSAWDEGLLEDGDELPALLGPKDDLAIPVLLKGYGKSDQSRPRPNPRLVARISIHNFIDSTRSIVFTPPVRKSSRWVVRGKRKAL